MSKIEVDQITQQSGTTLTVGGGACKTAAVDATTVTIGRSGGTVTLASGATQSGFGRTGTVDWQTGSIKTTGFTAESGKGYFCNTDGGAFTATLPASPSAGDIVGLADYTGNFATANLTVGRNSSKIEGVTDDAKMTINRESKTLVYVDATQGWIPVNDNADPIQQEKFVAASGGNTTATCGNFKIHTFTGPGTFTVSCAGNSVGSNTVDYLVIAGGGAGGAVNSGGGGAGGYRESSGAASGCYSRSPLGACVSALPVTAQGYPITVGGGGAAITGGSRNVGGSGNPSTFSTITSTGGGGGGGCAPSGPNKGADGGSGGGAQGSSPAPGANKGLGNTPPVSPSQGNPGGNSTSGSPGFAGAGGGGAGAAAADVTSNSGPGGVGGTGVASSITSSPVTRAGGGGGGGRVTSPGPTVPGGAGGSGGGGAGGGPGSPACTAVAGTTNTGGGGGGAGFTCSGQVEGNSGAGGSGIVIIRYKFQ